MRRATASLLTPTACSIGRSLAGVSRRMDVLPATALVEADFAGAGLRGEVAFVVAATLTALATLSALLAAFATGAAFDGALLAAGSALAGAGCAVRAFFTGAVCTVDIAFTGGAGLTTALTDVGLVGVASAGAGFSARGLLAGSRVWIEGFGLALVIWRGSSRRQGTPGREV